MKITKSQKVYGSVLGIGLCALLLDQVGVFGSPTTLPQIAATLAEAVEPVKAADPVTVRPPDPIAYAFDHGIATRLAALAKNNDLSGESRDGFVAPPIWSIRPVQESTAPDERAVRFQQSHILKAVLAGPRRSQAMVDDHLLSVGQSLDGFTLISLSQVRAVFSDGSHRVELQLAGTELLKLAEMHR